jgi:hypothetical protein
MFELFPVTSMGGSVNEQIPSQLPRVRSLLRVQAAHPSPSTKVREFSPPSSAKLRPFPKPNFPKRFMAPGRHLVGTTAVSRQRKLSFSTDSMTSLTQRLSLPFCWSHLGSDAMAWTCYSWLPHYYRSFCRPSLWSCILLTIQTSP